MEVSRANKSVLVLAVPHQLQGAGFQMYVDDPSYVILVQALLRDGVDFVFEEAAGRGKSIAHGLAEAVLGSGRYLDIDPPRDERHKYGIAPDTEEWFPVDPCNSPDMVCRLKVDEHRKREELWLERIQALQFLKGLAICGIGHALSIAFRLASAGLLTECYSYIPYDKLGARR